MDHIWNPMSVRDAREHFAASEVDWWVAGGYAIDLFLGWESRTHSDLDLEMFRSDAASIFDNFGGWDIHTASDGELRPWTNPDNLDENIFGLWLRPSPGDSWQVEILLADGDRSEWSFRRDPSIVMAGDRLVRQTFDGIPYCTPEVQLLYKSKQARQKDDLDLARCLHLMSTEQRSWLRDAVERTNPQHPWVPLLGGTLEPAT